MLDVLLRFFPGGGGSAAFFGRSKVHAGAAGFRQSDGDGLFGGGCAVFSRANMIHFFAHEFAGLGAGRFAFPRIFPGAFQSFLFGHG